MYMCVCVCVCVCPTELRQNAPLQTPFWLIIHYHMHSSVIWEAHGGFFMAQQALYGARPPHYRGFAITLRHTTLGRTALDEWSTRRRDLYLTTHNTHKRQTSMHPGGIRTRNPCKLVTANRRLRPHCHRYPTVVVQRNTEFCNDVL